MMQFTNLMVLASSDLLFPDNRGKTEFTGNYGKKNLFLKHNTNKGFKVADSKFHSLRVVRILVFQIDENKSHLPENF